MVIFVFGVWIVIYIFNVFYEYICLKCFEIEIENRYYVSELVVRF